MPWTEITTGSQAVASQIQQIVNVLEGTGGAGIPVSLTGLNDAANYTLTIRNNGTGGLHLKVISKANASVFPLLVTDAAITLGVPLAMGGSAVTSPVLTSPTVSDQIDLTQVASPAAPGTSLTRLYSKNDGNLYYRPNGGVETVLSTGVAPGSGIVALDGTTSNGVSATPARVDHKHGVATPNLAYNGGFALWQRGTSSAAGNTARYTADRWEASYTGNSTITRQTGTLGYSQYMCRVSRDSGQTAVSAVQLFQSLEIADCPDLASRTITLSFRARGGTSFVATGLPLVSYLISGTGSTDTSALRVGFTGQASNTQNNTLTTSMQSFNHTATLPAGTTQIAFGFLFNATGTAGATEYYEIEAVNVVVGTVAPPYRAIPISEEVRRCQRYYEKSYAIGTAPGAVTAVGQMRDRPRIALTDGNTYITPDVQFKSRKRVAPTCHTYSPSTGTIDKFYRASAAADYVTGSITNASNEGFFNAAVNGAVGSSTMLNTAAEEVDFQWTADAEL